MSNKNRVRGRAGLEDFLDPITLPVHLTLEEASQQPGCPQPLRQAIVNSMNWLWRNEITLERLVLSPDLSPVLIAWLLAWGNRIAFEEGEDLTALAEYLDRTGARAGKIASIVLPASVPGRVWGESSLRGTTRGQRIVSAVAVIDQTNGKVGEARLALTGVWREGARLAASAKQLIGKVLDGQAIYRMGEAVMQEVKPGGDFLGSRAYRREMAGLVTGRALQECMEKAGRT